MDKEKVESLVLQAIKNLNLAREPGEQITVSPEAPLFGDGPLDSMGLVGLLIDIEDLMAENGYHITLMDEKAMSQKRNPFRDVPSLVSYIIQLEG